MMCGLHDDFTFGYFNPAWERSAIDNGAPDLLSSYGLGSSWWRCVPAVLAPFLSSAFESARRNAHGHWEHGLSCPSAELERQWRMRILWLPAGGYLLDYQLLAELPHDGADAVRDPIDYRPPGGMFVQCAHCRRMKRPRPPEAWDWVPSHVRSPPRNTTHALCETCFAFFYPGS